jgi:SET domain-containing protein
MTAELLLVSLGDWVAESSQSASSSSSPSISSEEDLSPSWKPLCFPELSLRGFGADGPSPAFRCICVCDKLRASAFADLFLRRFTCEEFLARATWELFRFMAVILGLVDGMLVLDFVR